MSFKILKEYFYVFLSDPNQTSCAMRYRSGKDKLIRTCKDQILPPEWDFKTDIAGYSEVWTENGLLQSRGHVKKPRVFTDSGKLSMLEGIDQNHFIVLSPISGEILNVCSGNTEASPET